jgi:23S rRNA (guanosine2251-2'-O)-methyltransferase
MYKIVILENIRSAYNVGNIIRTADALWWEVWMTGYTPTPSDSSRIGKSALGSQDYVPLRSFATTQQAIGAAKVLWCVVIAAELCEWANQLKVESQKLKVNAVAVVLWNEVVGVEQSTLSLVDSVVYIPMHGYKESLNVGQTAAIFMWELS